jgi:tartrate dehydrogenase/decarboxylase/D-malate dehydrogenase
MMMEHLHQPELAGLILEAIEEVLAEGKVLTPDLGGKASTAEVGGELVRKLKALSEKF